MSDPTDTAPFHPEQTGADPGRAREPGVPEFIGRYRVLRELGRGGFGAVKVPHEWRVDKAEGYLAEARTVARLDHPNIVPVYDVMLAVLRERDWPARPGMAAVRSEVLTYFENQVHRMDYPTYEANGWFIGSGAVESACKTVVGHRLKGSGMRWSESGGDAVCHVRALYRSERGQWNAFWRPSLAA